MVTRTASAPLTHFRVLLGVLAVAALLTSLLAVSRPARAEEGAGNASLNVKKEDANGHKLAGAVFTVEGMQGTFTTGDDGKFCITGLAADSQWLVTEIQAPPGYALADPASQLVEVDNDGDCNSPSARFVNTLQTASPTPARRVQWRVARRHHRPRARSRAAPVRRRPASLTPRCLRRVRQAPSRPSRSR